jgi:hypothetical protein
MHGAGAQLRLHEAGAVDALVVHVPMPIGGHHRVLEQHGQRGQHLEEGWVLGVVRHIVVQDRDDTR